MSRRKRRSRSRIRSVGAGAQEQEQSAGAGVRVIFATKDILGITSGGSLEKEIRFPAFGLHSITTTKTPHYIRIGHMIYVYSETQQHYDTPSSTTYNPGWRNKEPFQNNNDGQNRPSYVPLPIQQQRHQMINTPAPTKSTLEELVRQMTMQNMQF
ncbi:hypothetical protein Lal_00015133 [Lupinus albus]|nr:hypothetical protein Lal_00015133 [Lupinus albus]